MAVIDRARVETTTRSPGAAAELGALASRALSDAGGLTQFGAHLQVLDPGARSSNRHWHEAEDEFLYLLDGAAVLVEETGETALAPGDAVAWPAGVANGHMVVNRSDRPCSYLIVGTRIADDICHYPDLRQTLFNGPHWKIVDDATGAVIREGDE